MLLLENPAAMAWIEEKTRDTEYLLSVCTGALAFGKLGLLDGLESTTHYSAYDALEQIAPRTIVRRGARWVDNGKVMTSAGVSAGTDLALHLVDRLLGPESAQATARYMEYEGWPGA